MSTVFLHIFTLCAAVVFLVVYARNNWIVFRRFLRLTLPAGILTCLLMTLVLGDFWRNLSGCLFITCLASAFLTWVEKQQQSAE